MFSQILMCGLLLFVLPAIAQDCMTDPGRAHEVEVLDRAEMAHYQQRFGAIAVPKRVQDILQRLVQASTLRGRSVVAQGYRHKRLSAHAADFGAVLVSSAAWGPQLALSVDELAAVLAHELAHIEQQDSLSVACTSLARVGSSAVSVKEALRTVGAEAFDASTELAGIVRQEQQGRELAADERGIELLAQAGFKPQGMALLVQRLEQGTQGFTAGTHPEGPARLVAVQRKVALLRL